MYPVTEIEHILLVCQGIFVTIGKYRRNVLLCVVILTVLCFMRA